MKPKAKASYVLFIRTPEMKGDGIKIYTQSPFRAWEIGRAIFMTHGISVGKFNEEVLNVLPFDTRCVFGDENDCTIVVTRECK